MTAFWILLAILCYLATGVGTAMLWLWLDVWDYEDFGEGPDPFFVGLATVFWPLATIAALATVCIRATVNAKERRTTIREEMEREAKKAAKEVEDFLRSAR